MKKYEFTLKTVSPVILSPRMQGALYNKIDYQKSNLADYEIIYPFYSFDNRYNQPGKEYRKADSYYIPASSFKGALQLEKTIEGTSYEKSDREEENSNLENKLEKIGKYFICSDIKVDSKLIQVKSLQKYQYLYQETGIKEPKLEPFFPKIGMEMLNQAAELTGEIIVKDIEVDWKKTCQNLNRLAMIKLKNNIEEINKLEVKYKEKTIEQKLEKNYKEKLKYLFELREELKKIEKDIDNADIKAIPKVYIFLGGFKGLLQSLSYSISVDGFSETSFFIDDESKLLYGLASLEIKEYKS